MSDLQLFSETELTAAESEERAHHERVVDDVKDGIEKLAGIGDASLKALRDKRLYRSTHKTFEDYCQERFSFDRRYVNRQIFHGAMREILGPRGPKTEKQSRPLGALPTPDLQAQAWQNAQADSGKEQPAAREVEQAVAALKAEIEEERRRSGDWKDQWKRERDKGRELQAELDIAKAAKPEPAEKIVAPADYEESKRKAAALEQEIARLKAEQQKTINSHVRAKLRGYQEEVNEMERRKRDIEDTIKRKQDYLASLSSEEKLLELHDAALKDDRASLSSTNERLMDLSPTNNPEIVRRWLAQAEMHQEIADGIRSLYKPSLALVQGGARP